MFSSSLSMQLKPFISLSRISVFLNSVCLCGLVSQRSWMRRDRKGTERSSLSVFLVLSLVEGEKRSGITNDQKYHLSYSFCIFVFLNSVCLRSRKTRDPKGTERSSLYLSVLHSVCVSVSVCMTLLVTEAGKKERYKKRSRKKRSSLSLSLRCLLSFSTLFVCPS